MKELFESVELTEDTAYQELYTDLSVKTDNWEAPFGEVRYANKTDADIAVSILRDRYTNVHIEPLDYKNGDDLMYHITYSDDANEDFDPNGLNWMEDKNPMGTPIGGGMGEALEEDAAIECPHCGGQAEYIEGQGNFRFYKCLDCGEYLFKNKKGDIKKADDAFDADGNLLTEANEDDSFRAAQAHYDSLKTDAQQEVITSLESKLSDFDMVNVEQLIPTEGEKVNMHVDVVKWLPEEDASVYLNKVESVLKEAGATDIKLQDAEINNRHRDDEKRFGIKVYGFFYLDGMTLKEAIEKHDELNQKIFNGDEIDPEVKDKLLEIVEKFQGSLAQDEVKLDIKDVVIVGSSASYNYTKDSDIDLHIIADLSAYPNQEELAGKLYNAYKALFNNKYDPTIYGIPVEVYVEPYVDEQLGEAKLKDFTTYNDRFMQLPKEKQEIVKEKDANRHSVNWDEEPIEVQSHYEQRFKKEIDAYNKKRYGFTW